MSEEHHHAVCAPCARVITREDEGEAREIVESHNESMHDGESVAQLGLDDIDTDGLDRSQTSRLVEEVIRARKRDGTLEAAANSMEARENAF